MRWMVYVQVCRGVGWLMCRSVEALDGLCADQSRRWMVYVQVSRGVGWFMCRSVDALGGLCADKQ